MAYKQLKMMAKWEFSRILGQVWLHDNLNNTFNPIKLIFKVFK